MAYAVKESSRVQAWEIGSGSVMEQEMIRCGKIVARPGGIYEVFSREATGNSGILRVDPDNPDRCFTASIWETEETAASDAVVVIFDTDRDAEGRVTGVNFNFVEIGYFNKHYRVIES